MDGASRDLSVYRGPCSRAARSSIGHELPDADVADVARLERLELLKRALPGERKLR